MITIEQVRQRASEIDDTADDSEAAHRAEDQLYRDVLAAIAGGAPDAAELARAALVTREYDFDRCYSFGGG